MTRALTKRGTMVPGADGVTDFLEVEQFDGSTRRYRVRRWKDKADGSRCTSILDPLPECERCGGRREKGGGYSGGILEIPKVVDGRCYVIGYPCHCQVGALRKHFQRIREWADQVPWIPWGLSNLQLAALRNEFDRTDRERPASLLDAARRLVESGPPPRKDMTPAVAEKVAVWLGQILDAVEAAAQRERIGETRTAYELEEELPF